MLRFTISNMARTDILTQMSFPGFERRHSHTRTLKEEQIYADML